MPDTDVVMVIGANDVKPNLRKMTLCSDGMSGLKAWKVKSNYNETFG